MKLAQWTRLLDLLIFKVPIAFWCRITKIIISFCLYRYSSLFGKMARILFNSLMAKVCSNIQIKVYDVTFLIGSFNKQKWAVTVSELNYIALVEQFTSDDLHSTYWYICWELNLSANDSLTSSSICRADAFWPDWDSLVYLYWSCQ